MKRQIVFSMRVLVVSLVIASLILTGSPAVAQVPTPTPGASGLDNSPSSSPLQTPPVPMPQPAASGGSDAFSPQSVSASLAVDDRYNTDPTGWYVYEHQTVTDVTNTVNTGLRPIDIIVESFSPSYLFTVVYVVNSGSYAKTWWWYVGVDEATLNAHLSANNARLISLKAYDIGSGQIRFTAIMISNTGSDAIGWWWYYNQTVAGITTLWQANQARLTQVDAYVTAGQTRYAVVMVDNTNANNQSWWWYVNASVGSISTLINTNNARLVDLDLDPTSGNYNVIMTGCTSNCPLWWWYVGVPTSQLLNLVNQDGARIIDANSTPGCGDRCWSFILINNSNAITSRVGQMLRNQTDGTLGLYLKQVGGPVLANLMDGTVYEPASAIKVVTNLYTMRQIQAGSVSLSTAITKYVPPVSGSCPGNTPNGTETIDTASREMMWHSDNTRTRELNDFFGTTNVNLMASAIGMTHTAILHIIGCGGPVPDQTTLDDLATLYEGVANASLIDATHRDMMFSHMAGKAQFTAEGYDWTGLWSTDLPNIINQEAPAGMSSANKAWFLNSMDLAYKAGNYNLCTTIACTSLIYDIAISGWAKIPFCDAGGPRQFVFGTFINTATNPTNSAAAFTSTKAELLREQIHAGLATCAYREMLPLVKR